MPNNEKNDFRRPPSQTSVVIAAVVSGILLVTAITGFFVLKNAGPTVSAAVAVLLGLLVPIAAGAGYIFGRNEVRGFFRGVDMAADKLYDGMIKTVNVRDRSTVRVHKATAPAPPAPQPPAQVAVVLPGLQNLQKRIVDSTGDGEDIIDM